MLTMEEFDQLRPYDADANFEGASAHLIEKFDAELRQAKSSMFDAFPPEKWRGPSPIERTPKSQPVQKRKKVKQPPARTIIWPTASAPNRSSSVAKPLTIPRRSWLRLRKVYSPVNEEEAILTDKLAQALWRFNWAHGSETQMFQVSQCHRLQSLRHSRRIDEPCSPKLYHQPAPTALPLRRAWACGARSGRADKGRCLNLCNDIRACGADDDGPARRHATRHDQSVIWCLFEQKWSTSGGPEQHSHFNNDADVESKDMTQFPGDNTLTLAFIADFVDRINRCVPSRHCGTLRKRGAISTNRSSR